MAASAVHVVDEDVIATGYGDAVVLVDHDTVANFRVVRACKIEA